VSTSGSHRIARCFHPSPFPSSALLFALLIEPKAFSGSKVFDTKEKLVGKKLYVGNLTYSVSSSNLQDWFASYGTVRSALVITDRETGDSKGFGFVEMDTDTQAQAAIQGLDDNEHEGRRLKVSEAKPREARTVILDGRVRL
jgi:cold-inducible RNA-binding protein